MWEIRWLLMYSAWNVGLKLESSQENDWFMVEYSIFVQRNS